ncbi:MAG: type III-B CRISPR module RAMP protein Cmr6 [bacterium]
MTKERYLHFTLGPVQSFVGQARRTRDYWAGSFILAYLTGHAMAAVLEKGKIIYPSVMGEGGTDKDPLLAAIMEVKEKGRCQAGPRIATLPNRFMAQVPGDFQPADCAAAVKEAWGRIAAAVWDGFIAPVEGLGQGVREIWDRQVKNFWDISWVLADTDKEVDILDRRKNWRSHVPTVEPGDKCTLLGNYQELSGFVRVRPKERERQDEFWQCLRGLRDRLAWYELRPDERLCAISLIKRLFPRVSVEAIGWPVEESFPSTTMMAAVHWMEKIATTETELAITFAQEALRIPDVRRQSYRQIICPDLRHILHFYLEERWQRTIRLIEALGGKICYFRTRGRFVTGLGRDNPVENGFAWHYNLGVPYLPGSSVKGLVKAWADALADDGEVNREEVERICGSARDEKGVGSLIFFPALPQEQVILEADVMTPHYSPYYQGDREPADWHSPVPIPFLTVAAEQVFGFPLAPRRPANKRDLERAVQHHLIPRGN